MKETLTVEKEVQNMLDNSMTTAEALAKLKTLSLPKWDEDPEFIAGVAKGQITEDILAVMEEDNINKSKLAERLGKSRQYVSRVLNETANFTIDSLAEIACALNRKIEVRMIGKNQHIFITDNYRKTESKSYAPMNNIYDMNRNIDYSADAEFKVADKQAEYNVNKDNGYEKKLQLAS